MREKGFGFVCFILRAVRFLSIKEFLSTKEYNLGLVPVEHEFTLEPVKGYLSLQN